MCLPCINTTFPPRPNVKISYDISSFFQVFAVSSLFFMRKLKIHIKIGGRKHTLCQVLANKQEHGLLGLTKVASVKVNVMVVILIGCQAQDDGSYPL